MNYPVHKLFSQLFQYSIENCCHSKSRDVKFQVMIEIWGSGTSLTRNSELIAAVKRFELLVHAQLYLFN